MPTAAPPKIKGVAPWAGSKRTLAPRIVELLGPHDLYAEPFCGGCSILPVKSRAAVELLNDLNPKIVNVLACLRDQGERLAGILADVRFDKLEYLRACDDVSRAGSGYPCEKSGVALAAAQLVQWWMGPNGTAGTTVKGWFAQRHTKTGGSPEVRWESFKASLPALAERLKGVELFDTDFRRFLNFFVVPDRPGVSIYADPPYFTKEFAYERDFGAADHTDLAEHLNRYRHARIVLSYRDEIEGGLLGGGSLLDELYPPDRWRRVEVEMNKAMAAASGTARRNVEVLLVNDAKGGA